MSRIYGVPFAGTITAAGGDCDLWSFIPASQKPIKIRGFTLGQTSEVGDVAEESVRITVKRFTAAVTAGTGGSAGSAVQPVSSINDTSWGFAVRMGDATTVMTGSSTQILDEFAWNLRNSPYEHWYPDERFCPGVFNALGMAIRIETTLADDISFSGVCWVEEEG